MSTATTAAPPSSDRTAAGQFARGNPGGPGNPFARQVAALRQTVVSFLTPERLERILLAVLEKAARGDLAAARLLLAYGLGKPGPTVDPDRLDAQEWAGFKETADMMREMPQLLGAPDPELPLKAVRATRPVLAQEIGRKLGDALMHPEKYQEEIPDLELVEDDDPPSPNGAATAGPPSPNGDDLAWLAVLAARAGRAAPSANGREPRGTVT